LVVVGVLSSPGPEVITLVTISLPMVILAVAFVLVLALAAFLAGQVYYKARLTRPHPPRLIDRRGTQWIGGSIDYVERGW